MGERDYVLEACEDPMHDPVRFFSHGGEIAPPDQRVGHVTEDSGSYYGSSTLWNWQRGGAQTGLGSASLTCRNSASGQMSAANRLARRHQRTHRSARNP